jgi:hypothetical protein
MEVWIKMKCVKEKCKYYYPHVFQASYRICGLTDYSFHQDTDKNCPIDNCIAEEIERIEILKKYKDYLESL